MKNLQVVSLLLTLFVASMALAQTGNLPDAPLPQESRPQESSSNQTQRTQPTNHQESGQQPGADKLISRGRPYPPSPRGPIGFPRGQMGLPRGPMSHGPMSRGPMSRRRGGYYRSPYAPAFSQPSLPEFSPAGALIGFGIGAGVGAAGTVNLTAKDRVAAGLLGGAFFALIGGAIGGSHSHSFRGWEGVPHRNHKLDAPRSDEPAMEASSTPAQAPSADFSRDSDSSTSTATTTEATGNTE
jgi:hypothetical protein